MTLQTGNKRVTKASAFTLIELVLVMAILIVVLSMTGTSLTSFFKGRTLDSEGRRFVALTRHAQERAVSEGVPMTLWINEHERKYGVEKAVGSVAFVEEDETPTEFELGRDLKIEVIWGSATPLPRQAGSDIILRFTPDAFIDETHPEAVVIKDPSGESIYVTQSRNRLNYEVSTNKIYTARR